MASFFFLSFLVVVSLDVVLGTLYQAQFKNYIKNFNKNYQSEEEFEYRLSIFSKNMEEAKRLQIEELGTAEYGETKFSDLTYEEFAEFRLKPLDALPPDNLTEYKEEAPPIQKSCDWRKAGVISPPQNQGRCGSCWAFAAVGNIEAMWGISGHQMNLSVQQILDCGPCEAGCAGGDPLDGFTTVIKEGGLVNKKDYPYKGLKGHCESYTKQKVGRIEGLVILPKNEDAMASFVGTEGTLTACLNATVLQHYKCGIFKPRAANCIPTTNHMVLLVGYSRDYNAGPYWIVKNSWGTDWGEKGFFRISRGKNTCGITTEFPLSAVINNLKKKTCPQ